MRVGGSAAGFFGVHAVGAAVVAAHTGSDARRQGNRVTGT